MIQHLLIKNYALIQQLEMEPNTELNIITGETGAGKSIMLGAIGLLLGNRADTKSLFDTNSKCIVEGHFLIQNDTLKLFFEEEELDFEEVCIIRRELSPQGKSRAFINDIPVNLDQLKKLGEKLIDIHSQNQTIALGNDEFQLKLLDSFAANYKLLEEYQTHYDIFQKIEKALNTLEKNVFQNKKELEYNQHIFEELNKAQLKENELETIIDELKIVENAEEVAEKTSQITAILNDGEFAAISFLENATLLLGNLAKYSTQFEELKTRTQQVLIELKDIYEEVLDSKNSVEFEPQHLINLQIKVDTYQRLLIKFKATNVAELIQLKNETEAKINIVTNVDWERTKLQKNLTDAQLELTTWQNKLTQSRIKVIPEIEKHVQQLLVDLGMPNAQFKIEIQSKNIGKTGADIISFLFSANKGVHPQPLKNVASGGEFSRLMLALKYVMADKNAMPTIIFDEIDTGVSGEISIKVGKMIAEMAKKHQIMVITHLHHMAAQKGTHFYVYKDHDSEKTNSKIRSLNYKERVSEIAQMIGGAKPSIAIVDNAAQILKDYGNIAN